MIQERVDNHKLNLTAHTRQKNSLKQRKKKYTVKTITLMTSRAGSRRGAAGRGGSACYFSRDLVLFYL